MVEAEDSSSSSQFVLDEDSESEDDDSISLMDNDSIAKKITRNKRGDDRLSTELNEQEQALEKLLARMVKVGPGAERSVRQTQRVEKSGGGVANLKQLKEIRQLMSQEEDYDLDFIKSALEGDIQDKSVRVIST